MAVTLESPPVDASAGLTRRRPTAQEVEDMLLQASRKIVQEKGAEVLCLGCAE